MFIKTLLLSLIILLSGCVLRTGASFHDPETDTYFRGAPVIGTVSFTQDLPDTNIEVYFQHKSLLFEDQESNCAGINNGCFEGGKGLNEIGANIKFNLY